MFYIVHDGVFPDFPGQPSCLYFFMLLWLFLSSLFAGVNVITGFLNARLQFHSILLNEFNNSCVIKEEIDVVISHIYMV